MTDEKPDALYGESSTVIGYIEKLFAEDSSWTVTINGEEYTLDGSTLTDANGDEVSELEAGTHTVVLSLAGEYEAWSDGTTEDITYVFTVYAGLVTEPTYSDALFGEASDVEGYLATLIGLGSLTVGDGAEYTVYINGEAITALPEYGASVTVGGVTITNTAGSYSFSVGDLAAGTEFFENQDVWYTVSAVYTYEGAAYEAACVVSDTLGVETYTVTLTLLSGYTWADGTDGTKTFTFINYLNNVASKSKTDLEPTALFGESDDVNGYLKDLIGLDTLTVGDGVEYTVYINGEAITEKPTDDGASVTVGGVTITNTNGSYSFSVDDLAAVTVAFSLAGDYAWSDGTHVSDAMDEFLGEEKVSFTEESLLGLNLYFTVGSNGEIESVYLLDPVYGAVYVYVDGSLDELYEDDGWPWTGNAVYDFSEEDGLNVTFYESTDKIGEDGIKLEEGDEGYESATAFSAILEATDCASGAIAIGYFECANCGMKVPVYAYMAHTFIEDNGVDTGLDMEAPKTDSGRATYNWTDATCTAAASHTGICKICGEVTVYGEGKLGHEYDYTIEVDEEANEIYVTAECARCGDETTLTYALYVQSANGTYHLSQNPLTGNVYYELCGEGENCTEGETKYVLNPGIAGLTVSRYAASDVTCDETTGIWATTEEATEGDPTCTEGAYNLYTLDGSEYSDSIGATYVNEDADPAADITAVWYVEPTAPTALFGTADTVNGYLKDLIDLESLTVGDGASYTVYINGEAITEKPGEGASVTVGGVTITNTNGSYSFDVGDLAAVTVAFSLAGDYAWSDGTTEDITYTFEVFSAIASSTPTEPTYLYGDSGTVIGYIGDLFASGTTEYTITINDGEYTYDSTLKDADGNEIETLEAGTRFFENQDVWYTVSAVYTYDGTAYEAACVVSEDLGVETYIVTLTLISGYTWADGTDGAKTFTFINYPENVTATTPTDPTALYGESSDVIGYIGDLFDDTDSSWTVTINGTEYASYSTGTLTDADGNEVETLEAGTYTVVLSIGEGCDVCGAINIDDMSAWEWISGGDHAWMWSDETYYTVERRTQADGTTAVLFVPEDGTYEIAGYCDVCGARVSVSFTLEDAKAYFENDAAWAKENADLADFFATYGFTFSFAYPDADGSWDCTAGTKLSFSLEISEGDTAEYSFDYWYGEDGTHVSDAMDEFLGEENVSFTEESLFGLNLYFTVGSNGEIESVYLLDPVYGAVYVYGDLTDLYDDGWPWEDNAVYEFDTALNITFYASEDKIGEDGIKLETGDEGYDSATEFSSILEATDCASSAIAIGYFECAECTAVSPEVADGWNWNGTACVTSDSAISGITAFFSNNKEEDGTIYYYISVVDEDGNVVESGTPTGASAGTTYYVTLTLADGYTWADGTDGDKRYTFKVLASATAPTADSSTWTNGTDAYGAYWTTSTDPTTDGITLTTIETSALVGYTVYVNGEKADLSSMADEDTVTVGGVTITYESSKYTFTEESLLGLNLYFETSNDEIVGVYLLDPVYGAVYVYGDLTDLYNNSWPWTGNAVYDFSDDEDGLNITFYTSEDKIGEDGIIIEESDVGYASATEFSSILGNATCAPKVEEVWSRNGTDWTAYDDTAENPTDYWAEYDENGLTITFADGLAEAIYNGTIIVSGDIAITATYDDGSQTYSLDDITLTAVGTYSVTFTLASGYAWKEDGSDAPLTFTFTVVAGTATAPTVNTGTWTAYETDGTDYWAEYDENGLTITFADGLAEAIYNGTIIVSGDIAITATYDDGSQTYSLDDITLTEVGTYSVTFTLASGYAWADGSDAPLAFTFTVVAGTATAPTVNTGTWTAYETDGTDYWAEYDENGLTITFADGLAAAIYDGTIIVSGDIEITSDGSDAPLTFTFTVVAGTATAPTAAETWTTQDANGSYYVDEKETDLASGITLLTISDSDLVGYTVYVNGEAVDLDEVADAGDDGLTVGGVTITYANGTGYTFTVYGYGEYTLTFVLDDGYVWVDSDGDYAGDADQTLTFIVYEATD